MYGENDFLVHYGISGQKWGIRRFQNEDRSLTEAGKERYGVGRKKESRREKREAKKAAKPESAQWKSKEAKYLSDEELNRRNSRLQRERQYRDLTKSRKRKFAEGVGKAATKIFIGSLVGVAASTMALNYKKLLPEVGNFIGSLAGVPYADMMNVG